MLRRIAKERESIHTLFFDVISLKLVLTVPILAIAAGLLLVADYGEQTRQVVAILAIGFVFETLADTIHAVFLAHERNGLIAAVVVVQRVAGAAAGLVVLAAGYGVVAVAATYSGAAAIGLVMAALLLARRIGLPRRIVSTRGWPRLTAMSLPFGLQDLFSVMLFRLDTVILSLMATQAAVGRYGGRLPPARGEPLHHLRAHGRVRPHVHLSRRQERADRRGRLRALGEACAGGAWCPSPRSSGCSPSRSAACCSEPGSRTRPSRFATWLPSLP